MDNIQLTQQENDLQYHGIFKKLQTLDVFDMIDCSENMYGSDFSGFYDLFSAENVGDVALYAQALKQKSSNILDLGCGSGRIGIPLARLGHNIEGLDLSSDMIKLAEKIKKNEPDEIKSQLNFSTGDMTHFEFNKKFDFILLGCTSISLLLKKEQRLSLFKCIKKHLKNSGTFMFDIIDHDHKNWQSDVWFKENDNGQEFAIVGQKSYPEHGLFSFNIYRESIDWEGNTQRYIGSSTKALLTKESVLQELSHCRLTNIETFKSFGCVFFKVTQTEV
ncbi:MAG: class I SAM-dependent methyltransferase [Colwellia sp.]|nr:class I SAM-dependent methyltransferase [Colwellia sp.]